MPLPPPRPAPGRLRSWAREHPLTTDLSWALLWFVLTVATWPFPNASAFDTAVHLALAAGCCAALGARRARPLPSMAVLAVLLAVQVWWMGQFTTLSVVCALVTSYTSQTELAPAGRRLVLAALLTGTAGAVLFVPHTVFTEDLGVRVASLLFGWTTLLMFALLGAVRRHNREEVDRLREHALLLETKREQELRLAALDERARIAREMHDVLAHSLNVIVAQADGGRYAASTAPERAVAALTTIGRVGRESSREVHRLLGVLREDDPRPPRPAPGLEALVPLVDEYREAGLRVRLVREGDGPGDDAQDPPASVSLTVYRLLQESLANVLKHAGPVAVRVGLVRTPGRIAVSVANPLGTVPPGPGERPHGHGLVGMRERVALHGGSLEAGVDPASGTWRMRAVVPWEQA
ncbi:sensor histidine kinase [Nocardiopsis sp. L17-MgMaSL7]|uniref:sensor histidine kinase n=1 Tax=Nocardiopsis sp. L17-MgMaSL7 TaxID=1938893 RepID=UPI000D70F6BA|nr:histidine kinase [Nocardiopsis sp. L17-MgMaSL7]PWV52094.1 signal transduction histidine kinase [Nocardiopsis sp. L17-MgMaSL7]